MVERRPHFPITKIPKSETRQRIDILLGYKPTGIPSAVFFGPFEDSDLSYSLARYDKVGELEGIDIIERRDPAEDARNDYRCAQFVFGDIRGEAWARRRSLLTSPNFGRKVEAFLLNSDYRPVLTPQEEDIVAYREEKDGGFIQYNHFGIYQANKKVRSKFDFGHIYEHLLRMIPNAYGDEVIFFRK